MNPFRLKPIISGALNAAKKVGKATKAVKNFTPAVANTYNKAHAVAPGLTNLAETIGTDLILGQLPGNESLTMNIISSDKGTMASKLTSAIPLLLHKSYLAGPVKVKPGHTALIGKNAGRKVLGAGILYPSQTIINGLGDLDRDLGITRNTIGTPEGIETLYKDKKDIPASISIGWDMLTDSYANQNEPQPRSTLSPIGAALRDATEFKRYINQARKGELNGESKWIHDQIYKRIKNRQLPKQSQPPLTKQSSWSSTLSLPWRAIKALGRGAKAAYRGTKKQVVDYNRGNELAARWARNEGHLDPKIDWAISQGLLSMVDAGTSNLQGMDSFTPVSIPGLLAKFYYNGYDPSNVISAIGSSVVGMKGSKNIRANIGSRSARGKTHPYMHSLRYAITPSTKIGGIMAINFGQNQLGKGFRNVTTPQETTFTEQGKPKFGSEFDFSNLSQPSEALLKSYLNKGLDTKVMSNPILEPWKGPLRQLVNDNNANVDPVYNAIGQINTQAARIGTGLRPLQHLGQIWWQNSSSQEKANMAKKVLRNPQFDGIIQNILQEKSNQLQQFNPLNK